MTGFYRLVPKHTLTSPGLMKQSPVTHGLGLKKFKGEKK